jgi:hypothetical protein
MGFVLGIRGSNEYSGYKVRNMIRVMSADVGRRRFCTKRLLCERACAVPRQQLKAQAESKQGAHMGTGGGGGGGGGGNGACMSCWCCTAASWAGCMGITPGWTICGRRPGENAGLTGAPLKTAGCETLGPSPGFAFPRVRRGSWAYLHAAPYEHLPLRAAMGGSDLA